MEDGHVLADQDSGCVAKMPNEEPREDMQPMSLFGFLKEATKKSDEKVQQYAAWLMENDIETLEDLMEVDEACNMRELPLSLGIRSKVENALHKRAKEPSDMSASEDDEEEACKRPEENPCKRASVKRGPPGWSTDSDVEMEENQQEENIWPPLRHENQHEDVHVPQTDATLPEIDTPGFTCQACRRVLQTSLDGSKHCPECDEALRSVGMCSAVELFQCHCWGGSGT